MQSSGGGNGGRLVDVDALFRAEARTEVGQGVTVDLGGIRRARIGREVRAEVAIDPDVELAVAASAKEDVARGGENARFG